MPRDPTQQGGSTLNSVIVPGITRTRFREVTIRDRGRLPHWERKTAVYFVTFRLADSLPQQIVRRLAERKRLLTEAQRSGRPLLPREKAAVAELGARKIEEYLDSGIGKCWLCDPRIASIVVNAIGYWDRTRYDLFTWCVMPNHVHVVFRGFPEYPLAIVVGAWKSYTAKTANRILGRTSAFWEREYYDRLIRNGSEFDRAVQYVRANPERAGLKNWKWIWCAGEDALTTAGETPALPGLPEGSSTSA